MRSWPLKLFTVVLGATTNVQKKYQVLGVQKLFGHMAMQPLYAGSSLRQAAAESAEPESDYVSKQTTSYFRQPSSGLVVSLKI